MLNRRQLRIKAMEIVYCFSNSTQNELEKHLEVFKNSTDKFYHLYIFILSFFVEFKNYCNERLELSKKKFLKDQSFDFYLKISKNVFLKKITSLIFFDLIIMISTFLDKMNIRNYHKI